jgi:hypothetical protein
MRALVLALALLACLKVWAQDSVYRAATEDAIISAYRDRAIASCQKDSRGLAPSAATSWTNPADIKLVIGNANVPVYIWELDHELWNARYKNPYLVLSAGPGARLVCTYDIGSGLAEVPRA